MFRKILHIVVAVALLAYLFFAVAFMSPQVDTDNQTCAQLHIKVVQNDKANYLDKKQIDFLIQQAGLYPVGEKLSAINTASIETALQNNQFIKQAEVYKAIDGSLNVKVEQRVLVMRVLTDRKTFYIDSEKFITPVDPDFPVYVPLASGNISEKYAREKLYDFALFLQNNSFWNTQIEQIHVAPNLDVELTPRKGNHTILLGKIEDYSKKLGKLQVFYEQGLDKVGWNKYSVINLKYTNQVIGTIKE